MTQTFESNMVRTDSPQVEPSSITFRGNRIKHIPAAIILAPLVIFFTVLVCAIFRSNNVTQIGRVWFGVAILLVFFLTALLIEMRLIVGIMWPERIVLTLEGWTTVRLGKAITRKWADFNEAKESIVSTGRASQPCIRLTPKNGDKPVNILTLGYAYSMDDMLKAFQFAQHGQLVDPGEEDFPWLYLLMGIPLSIACVMAATVYIGPRFVASLHW